MCCSDQNLSDFFDSELDYLSFERPHSGLIIAGKPRRVRNQRRVASAVTRALATVAIPITPRGLEKYE